MRVVFVTTGLEHLGIEALSAYLRAHGHEPVLVYEPRPFSSGSGTDIPLLAKLLEPPPEETAARVVREKPDVVAFTSYSVTHRWSVSVARAIKATIKVPIVFGGPHCGAEPEYTILEPAIDAVVEGEGEGALLDLVECAETNRFGRRDIANVTTKGTLKPRRNLPRPLIDDLDTLPFAEKSGFYGAVPGYEHEFYTISRRGCPFRCSFCEYSTFPEQYPGQKPVRRRSVEHVLRELRPFKARGVMKKVFFWDPIFTLDNRWMAEFAEAYRSEIGIPFECYTHPNAMNPEMARLLAEAGCTMVRVGVQTVNSDTLAAVDRRGDEDRIRKTISYLHQHGLPYTVDHIIGLPGEGPVDQIAAIKFYNEVRPRRVIAHWMTYFPGTTAFNHARKSGLLTPASVAKILAGDVGPGFMYTSNIEHPENDELRRLSNLFDILPLLSPAAVDWLMNDRRYMRLPTSTFLRQVGVVGLALQGDRATKDRIIHLASAVVQAVADTLKHRSENAHVAAE